MTPTLGRAKSLSWRAIPSPVVLGQITERFRDAVKCLAEREQIPVHPFIHKEKKDDIANRFRRECRFISGDRERLRGARMAVTRRRRVDREVLIIHDGSSRIDKVQTDYERLANHSQKARFQILHAPRLGFLSTLITTMDMRFRGVNVTWNSPSRGTAC